MSTAAVWDWMLFVAAVFLCMLIVLRSLVRQRAKPYRFGGLLWFANSKSYWGPSCEDCLVQYLLFPAFQSSDGVQYYELICPICHKPFPGVAFTLQALLSMDQQFGEHLKKQRAGVSLTATICDSSRTQQMPTQ